MPNYSPHKERGGRVPNGFKKGDVPNPKGSSERARKLGRIKRLTIDELAEVGTLILRHTRDDLSRMKEDCDTSILQYWIMSLVSKSIQKGDVQTFDTLMTRLIGKPPETPISRDLLEMMADNAEL